MRDKTNKQKKGQTLMNTMKKKKIMIDDNNVYDLIKFTDDGFELKDEYKHLEIKDLDSHAKTTKHKSSDDALKSISKKFSKEFNLPLDYTHTTMVDGVKTSWYLKDNKVVRVNQQSETIQ